MNQQEESMKGKALIQCVAFFYEKGKCKLDHIRKEKFRASSIERNMSTLRTLTRMWYGRTYVWLHFF